MYIILVQTHHRRYFNCTFNLFVARVNSIFGGNVQSTYGSSSPRCYQYHGTRSKPEQGYIRVDGQYGGLPRWWYQNRLFFGYHIWVHNHSSVLLNHFITTWHGTNPATLTCRVLLKRKKTCAYLVNWTTSEKRIDGLGVARDPVNHDLCTRKNWERMQQFDVIMK